MSIYVSLRFNYICIQTSYNYWTTTHTVRVPKTLLNIQIWITGRLPQLVHVYKIIVCLKFNYICIQTSRNYWKTTHTVWVLKTSFVMYPDLNHWNTATISVCVYMRALNSIISRPHTITGRLFTLYECLKLHLLCIQIWITGRPPHLVCVVKFWVHIIFVCGINITINNKSNKGTCETEQKNIVSKFRAESEKRQPNILHAVSCSSYKKMSCDNPYKSVILLTCFSDTTVTELHNQIHQIHLSKVTHTHDTILNSVSSNVRTQVDKLAAGEAGNMLVAQHVARSLLQRWTDPLQETWDGGFVKRIVWVDAHWLGQQSLRLLIQLGRNIVWRVNNVLVHGLGGHVTGDHLNVRGGHSCSSMVTVAAGYSGGLDSGGGGEGVGGGPQCAGCLWFRFLTAAFRAALDDGAGNTCCHWNNDR